MSCSYIVIGANYGDEGKGLITDFLARTAKPDYVVRFNGGAQAGHTVESEGSRSIFKHISAGTFARIPTLLSEFFICNPILFNSEITSHDDVEVLADGRALVSTPFDMLINQAMELVKGKNKHGSCGIGINETMTRSEDPEVAIKLHELSNHSKLREKLIKIRDEYFYHRIASIGLDNVQACDLLTNMEAPVFIDGFLDECEAFMDRITMLDSRKLRPKRVVFEGAQGLGLDELSEGFPHVTRSRTGMTNALTLARAMRLGDNIMPVYVSRAYLTRHGAGYLENELPDKPYIGINERTNVENQHQGAFRYGHLNLDKLKHRIELDRSQAPFLDASIAVTCLDQVDKHVDVCYNSKMITVPKHDLPRYLKGILGSAFTMAFGSYGSTADDVKRMILGEIPTMSFEL